MVGALHTHIQTGQEATVSLSTTLLILGAILALPGGLFVASLISQPRSRWLALVGAVVVLVLTAGALEYYRSANNVGIDAFTWFLAAFLACSLGAGIGALLVGFLTGGSRSSEIAQEF
jgi:hypothetical protein